MDAIETEIAIIGGGLVGLAAVRAIALYGLDCVHVAPQAPVDRRTSALMRPSANLLHDLGLIGDPMELGTPLKRIRIVDASNRLLRAPETLFDSAEVGLDAFGWNFPNAALNARLTELQSSHAGFTQIDAAATQITRHDNRWQIDLANGQSIRARLLIGADGKKSLVRAQAGLGVREHKFGQSALVADLELPRPLGGESIEFHYQNGPFTLVPSAGTRANLVWIDRHGVLDRARKLETGALETHLSEKALKLFGRIKLASPCFVFPLSSLEAESVSAAGVLLVGEAAHAFPPIGAQGLNLGLRDIAGLCAALTACKPSDHDWAYQMAAHYQVERSTDMQRTGRFVDTLFSSLLSDFLPAQALRAGGLWALKLSPALREKAFEFGMGAQKS